MRPIIFFLAIGGTTLIAHGFQPASVPDGPTIMAKMSANLEAATSERRQYVYSQKVRARLVRTNGQVSRDERREYLAAPGPERTTKELVSVAGEYHKKKDEVIRYDKKGFETGGMDLDGGLMENLMEQLVEDKKSRDGIPHALFPFAQKDQSAYDFTLKETTVHKGRPTYRVAFVPIKKPPCANPDDKNDEDCERRLWKGEALVDAEDFQPVHIYTDLDFKMPWGVKVFLGTNLRQTGFSVQYTRVAPGVWFPQSYGAEFRLDLLFGYKRKIMLSSDASDFRKTDVLSKIQFDAEEAKPAPVAKP